MIVVPIWPLQTSKKHSMSQRINSQISQSTYGALPVTGFVRQPAVLACVPFSATTLWRRVKKQTFPAPVKLSERVTAWRAEDVRQWLAAQGAI